MCGIHLRKLRSWILRMDWMGDCTDAGGMRTTAVVWVLLCIKFYRVIKVMSDLPKFLQRFPRCAPLIGVPPHSELITPH